jgi:hypothetical protein
VEKLLEEHVDTVKKEEGLRELAELGKFLYS